jgi:uncharacterized protein (DUF58 family)
VSRSLSPRVRSSSALCGALLIAALALGRPELALLVVPMLLFVGIGLASVRHPQLAVAIKLERERLLEGERVQGAVSLRNEGGGAIELELELVTSAHLSVMSGGPLVLRLAREAGAEVLFDLRPDRWGAHVVGPLKARARDPLGLIQWSGQIGPRVSLRTFPREQRLRELVTPLRTQPFLGSHVARAPGEGIEFADIRPFVPGDRVRQINWHATARRGALYVTERHPEHASDVVLLLDTFAEARDGGIGTLDGAVRAAASIARTVLARRDRVALVDFGGTLQWLAPAFGTAQLYRIIDALLTSEIVLSYAWRDIESIPRRLLPSGALIIAITPLLDERSIRLLVELRTRGCDLSVIEVSPLTHTAPGSSPADVLAHRLWRLQRDASRSRLQGLGIGVALWAEDTALGPALEGVNAFRRSARHAVRA